MQKPIGWSLEKNEWLKARRGICFEDVAPLIESGQMVGIERDISRRHPGQSMFVVLIQGYAHAVPFVEDEEKIFLKTIYPSRRLNNKYLSSNDKRL